MSYPDAMVDIETLGTRPSNDFIILSVGIVAFDLEAQDTLDTIQAYPMRTQQWHLGIGEQRERHIDPNTVLWWMNQNDDAREAVTKARTIDMTSFFKQFTEFIHYFKIGRLWGNGPSFDNAALRHLFDSHAREFPLKFWCDRDLRTIQELYERTTGAKSRPEIEGLTAHSAIDDAVKQVLQAQFMEHRVRGG